MVKVQIVIFNGFDELDAIAPFEVLQTAAAMGADVQAELVTVEDATEIIAAHGLQIQPHGKLAIDEKLDLLIVPGGGWGDRAAQGAWAEAQRGKIPAAIARLHQSGTVIASVCTGAMLVAAAGLLTDRPAVTHAVAIDDLKASGAQIIDARVVDDGDIITAGGVTSGLELTLWVLERFISPQIAYAVAKEIEYERRGAVWQRSAV